MLTGNREVCRRLPFVEAPVWRKLPVPKEGLCQVRRGRDLVEFMDGILVTVVVDDEWENGLWGMQRRDRRHGTGSTRRLG